MSNFVKTVITNVSLRLCHKGLTALAQEKRIDLTALKPGEFIVFVNSSFTALKMFGANNVLSHYSHPEGKSLDWVQLKLVPSFFDGPTLSFDKRVANELKKKYPFLEERRQRDLARIEASKPVATATRKQLVAKPKTAIKKKTKAAVKKTRGTWVGPEFTLEDAWAAAGKPKTLRRPANTVSHKPKR